MALPPHLLNLQQKINSLNLPKLPKVIDDNGKSENPNPQINASKDQKPSTQNNPFQIDNLNTITQKKRERKIPKKMREKWKTMRKGAGKIWEDKTLDDWPDNDYRIFCGNLGNEVSDQILFNAFCRYKSLKKVKIIRNKNSGKSRGYGFISITDVNDYIDAMREMNGKYVGNRPILLKRSTWKDRSVLYNKSQLQITKVKKQRVRKDKGNKNLIGVVKKDSNEGNDKGGMKGNNYNNETNINVNGNLGYNNIGVGGDYNINLNNIGGNNMNLNSGHYEEDEQ